MKMSQSNNKSNKGLAAKQEKIRVYGKTRNFKANKRIQIRFNYAYTDKLGFEKKTRFEDGYQWFVENLAKNVYSVEGFLIIPSECIMVRYGSKNYQDVDGRLVATIFNGLRFVTNLDLDQVVEMAALMSTVRMMTMKKHLFITDAISLFIHNFRRYARDLSVVNSNIDINDQVAYERLVEKAKDFRVVIPYKIGDEIGDFGDHIDRIISSEKYGIINDFDMMPKFPPTFEEMENIITKKISEAKKEFDEQTTVQGILRVYEKKLSGFETERFVSSFETVYIQKMQPILNYRCPPNWQNELIQMMVLNVIDGEHITYGISEIEVPITELQAFKRTIQNLGTLRYMDFCFVPELAEEVSDNEVAVVEIPEYTSDIRKYVSLFKKEIEYQRSLQLMAQRFALNLKLENPDNMFFNAYKILWRAMERRELDVSNGRGPTAEVESNNINRVEKLHLHQDCRKLQNTTLDFEEPSTSKKEASQDLTDKNVFRRALDAFTQPVKSLKSSFSNIEDKIGDATHKIKEVANKISVKLDDKGFATLAKGFSEFDGSSFSATLGSIKMLANTFFDQALQWIYKQFGFNISIKLDVSDLVITYILWINTTSSQVKLLILGYLAMQCGILDFVFQILKSIALKVKDYMTNEDTGFAEELEKEEKALQMKKQNVMEDIEKKKDKITSIFEKAEEPDETLWEKVWSGLEHGMPIVLGLGVVGVAAAFAYDAVDKPGKIGDKVVKVCRAMSFIGLGLGSISAIIKHGMGIIKVAFDYINHYIRGKEDTKIKKMETVVNFLKKANYIPGVSNYVFATDTAAAVIFMRHYLEIPKIDKFIHEIEDATLRTTYGIRRREMTQMYGAVKAALHVAIQGAEIMHIQFYSEPGAGKTDLSQNVIKDLAAKFTEVRDALDEKKGLPKMPNLDDDTVYFGMECEKYKDLYYGQKYMIIDEMNFFQAEDQESIQFKLGLFSGKPTVANKAAIEDKGMLFNLNMVISNTNNPFPAPNDVISPEALQRRRILIEAKVKPEFLTDGHIDPQKIADAGANRNNSEHLSFTIIDPIKKPPQPVNSSYVDLDYHQLVRVLKVKVENHILTEESRLENRTGAYSHVRSHIESMINRVEQSTINGQDVRAIKKEILRLAAYLKNAKTVDFSDPAVINKEFRPMNRLVAATIEQYNRFRRAYDFIAAPFTSETAHQHALGPCIDDCGFEDVNFEGASILINRCPKCHYEACRGFQLMLNASDLLNIYPHTSYPDAEPIIMTEDTILERGENAGCTTLKQYQDKKGSPYVVLEKCDDFTPMGSINHIFDPTKFNIYKIKGKEQLVYEEEIPSDEDKRDSLLAYMRYLETMDSMSEVKKAINRKRSRYNANLIRLTYMERLKQAASSTWNTIKNVVVNFVSGCLGYLGQGLEIGITSMIAIVVIWGSLYGIGKLLSGSTDTAAYSKSIRTNTISRRLEDTSLFVENQNNENVKYARRGQVIMIAMDPTRTHLIGWINGCCIQGNVFMVPNHFLKNLKGTVHLLVLDPTKLTTSNNEGIYEMDVKVSDFKQIRGKDAALVALPKIRMMVSLKKKFITEEDLGDSNKNFSTFRASYQGYRAPSDFDNITVADFRTRINKNLYASEVMDSNPDPQNSSKFDMHTFKALGDVRFGDSGSLVVHTNTKMQSHFLVGHMIQRSNIDRQPVGVFITQEDLDMALQSFAVPQKLEVCHYQGKQLPETHEYYKVFDFPENVCLADKDRSINETRGFAKTPIFGVFTVETEPAILNSADPRIPEGARHPLKVSLNKSNGQNPPYISEEERDFMVKSLIQHYEKQLSYPIRTIRIYNTLDAIRGTKEMGSVPINIHSSAGLPYADMPGVSGKRPFIRYDEEQKTYVVQDRIINDVKLYEHLYKSGIIPQNMKLEFIKKELVGPNKIENPKTRTVGTGNIIHQIVYNKCNKALQLLVKNAWREGKTTSFAMGLDLEIHGNQIVQGLKYIDYMYDFDVKAWEASINYELLTMANEVKVKLMQKAYASRGQQCSYDYETISQALVTDYTDCDVHFKDVIYAKNSGLLSGHPGTFIENTDVHIMLVYLIARRILTKHKKLGWANATDIYNNIKVVVAADDIVMAISPLMRPYFTPEDIKWGYSTVGFEITSADKSPEINVKTVEEIQFLKHKFKKDKEGIYHAYPLTSIIYQLFNWYRTDTKLGREELLLQNYSDAFRFSFFIGEEFYENTRERFNKANLNNNIQWNFTYAEMRAMILQDREELNMFEHSNEPKIRAEAENFYDRFFQQ
ncbi:hypothetical protein 3 [Hubei picorna-like virus 82]|uniref:SF3 helicase domain-containing protein n=1 Tax=Hubei picorna-like virus 82 TaxID=1923167 RepID=A0A1L3KJ55_9VIRU|nr:hypothetical protein 3 [Hubei picorna-like virus 82]APG77437.1 hypothetical protein 3 [Hubei picorna-like virus 82]